MEKDFQKDIVLLQLDLLKDKIQTCSSEELKEISNTLNQLLNPEIDENLKMQMVKFLILGSYLNSFLE